MTIKLGSNQLSFAIQARLNDASGAVYSSSERLASGLRINKASDDAAGLAISSSLNLKSRIFTQGIRNLNDGLSAVNIAESAIGSLSEILVQIEELSVQSMSGTYSDLQRQSMQQQVTALQAEWNRLVEGTSFNGQQLLTGLGTRIVLQGSDGTDGTLAVQVGKELLAGGFADYAGGTSRVSTSSTGAQTNGSIDNASVSADGRYVLFDSLATNLVTGDSNSVNDVFVKDTATGTTTRVSTNSSGQQGNAQSARVRISDDNRFVVFESDASNLVSGDSNSTTDIFVKDLATGLTTRVSTDSSGQESNGQSSRASISSDGRYVLFQSTATNLVAGDSNGASDIFLKDLLTGVTTMVSTSSSGQQGSSQSTRATLSGDGRYVAFQSDASNLVTGDTNGAIDVFVKDTFSGVTTRISTTSGSQQANGASNYAFMARNGQFVAFQSSATNLVSGDTNGAIDSFVKDISSGVITRVSTDSLNQQVSAGGGAGVLSADGRFVLFQSSSSSLTGGDTNGANDIFVKDTITGITTRVSTSTSGQEGNGASVEGFISADGRYVTFKSAATNFVSGDTNGVQDLFLRDLTRTGIQTLAGMVVNNKASAAITLNLISTYKQELTEYRSNLGASTARISSFISTLDSGRTNYVQAASRITDTDIAEESATLVAATTRQRVASALLAQAKLAPQIALSLLRDA